MLGGMITGTPLVFADDHEECEFPVEVTDTTGETIVIEEEPTAIVTLAPSAAQTLWEIGAFEKVVGLSMHAMSLEGAEDRVDISADPGSIDVEAVVDLEPDLVFAPNVTPRSEIESLRELGVTVYHAEINHDLDDVMEKTLTKGELVGECEGAQETVDDMQARLDAIEAELADTDERPLAFYEMGDGFTAGGATFQHVALEQAGVTNLAAEVGIDLWEPISAEVLIDEDPAWIIHPEYVTEDDFLEATSGITAFETGQIITVSANNISQPAPRIVDAIETIHVGVHGELEDPAGADEPSPIPGFTAVLAVIAAAIFALVAVRRR